MAVVLAECRLGGDFRRGPVSQNGQVWPAMSDEIKLAAGVFLGALLLTVGLLEGLWYWQRRKNPPRDTNDEEAHPDY